MPVLCAHTCSLIGSSLSVERDGLTKFRQCSL